MDIFTVQELILERLNRYRRLHSMITGSSFLSLFEASKDKEGALKCIDAGDLSALEYWIKIEKRKSLDHMTVSDLRLECRLHGVPNYHLLQKEEMIERIKNDRVRAGQEGQDRQNTGTARPDEGTSAL